MAEEVTTDVSATSETEVESTDTDSAPQQGLSPEKLAELNRTLRNERKAAEKRAKEAESRAAEADQRWKQLESLFGGKGDQQGQPDPMSEIAKLRKDLESAERERQRVDIARLKGLEPEDIKGSSVEEMTASADRYLARFNARLEKALADAKAPAAPPASLVTSDAKITGPQQITSREDLKKMTPQQISAARKEGRLDTLLGKTST